MRPTTKDLAKYAGVSLATVDRVLNERPHVSKKTARKVNEAIEKIGFVRNLAAVNLAKNKVYRFRFVFPEAGDQYLAELLAQVAEANDAMMVIEEDVAENLRLARTEMETALGLGLRGGGEELAPSPLLL